MKERIIELETKVAFQEQAIAELSDALVRQQRHIQGLEKRVQNLHRQMEALMPGLVAKESEESPPPHY